MSYGWLTTIAGSREEALRTGCLTYATPGEVCENGHTSARRADDGRCMACIVATKNKGKYIAPDNHARLKVEKHMEARELKNNLKEFWED